MTAPVALPAGLFPVDGEALATRGWSHLPGLLDGDDLAGFERQMALLADREIRRRGLAPGRDPLVTLFRSNQAYREALFPHLKNLRAIHRLANAVAERIEGSGFLEHHGFEVPLIWPFVRFDPPDEDTYLLGLHQDFVTTRCRRAFRLWLPLRDCDPTRGTMAVADGSHRDGMRPHRAGGDGPKGYPTVDPGTLDVPARPLTVAAGDGILFDPLLVHGSVPNTGTAMKIVLLIQIQDLATLHHPEDPALRTMRQLLDDLPEALRRAPARR